MGAALINSAFIVIWLIFSLQVDTMNDLPNGHIIIIHHVKFERLNYFKYVKFRDYELYVYLHSIRNLANTTPSSIQFTMV